MDTGIRGDRIQAVKTRVTMLLQQMPDSDMQADGYVHMFGVGQACALIAMHRGEDVELASIAGYLHDIATYTTGSSTDHARRGAEMSRTILKNMDMFSKEEIDRICTAILFHSNKKELHGPLEEVLKDADVMQHFLSEPDYVSKKDQERCEKLRREFGLGMPG